MNTVFAVAIFAAMTTSAVAQEAPSAAAAGVPTPSAVWGNAEVDAYVSANRPRPASQVADPFAIPSPIEPPAHQVLLRYPVSSIAQATGAAHTAYWKYDVASQKLEVTTYQPSGTTLLTLNFQSQRQFASVIDRPRIHGWPTFQQTERKAAGTGQNAYGAQVEMTRASTVVRGIGELAPGFENPGPRPGERYSTAFKHELNIAPEDARALSEHIELQVLASTAPWAAGKHVICGMAFEGATVRNPTLQDTDACYLTGTILTVSFVDTRDGTVLRRWGRGGSRPR